MRREDEAMVERPVPPPPTPKSPASVFAKVRVPLWDFCRFLHNGALFGNALRTIYRDYEKFDAP